MERQNNRDSPSHSESGREYHELTNEFLTSLKTLFGDKIKASDLEVRLNPFWSKFERVELPATLFKLLHKAIIRREAVAIRHDGVAQAVRDDEISSGGVKEYFEDECIPDFDDRNDGHKGFIRELKKKQAILEEYAERGEVEMKEEEVQAKIRAERRAEREASDTERPKTK